MGGFCSQLEKQGEMTLNEYVQGVSAVTRCRLPGDLLSHFSKLSCSYLDLALEFGKERSWTHLDRVKPGVFNGICKYSPSRIWGNHDNQYL